MSMHRLQRRELEAEMPNLAEPTADWIGYAGSVCVLSAFCMRGMVALRATSIAGNMLFIAFALQVGVMPVLVMNALLLPLNCFRLLQCVRARSAAASHSAGKRALAQGPVIASTPHSHNAAASSASSTPSAHTVTGSARSSATLPATKRRAASSREAPRTSATSSFT
jgi:hypothetical protein